MKPRLQHLLGRWDGRVEADDVPGVLTSLAKTLAQSLVRLCDRRADGGGSGSGRWPDGAVRVYGSVWIEYLAGAVVGGLGGDRWGLAAVALAIAGLGLAVLRDLLHPHQLGGLEQHAAA